MKILISGGNGMVGTNLRKHLSSDDHHILSPSSSELNLLHKDAVNSYLKEKKPDVVIHCAGLVGGIVMNINNQALSLHNNTVMGLNLINASKENGIKKFVNLGSSCMYPKDLNNELRIEDLLSGKLEPTNEGYAISKILIWKYLKHISDNDFVGKTIIPCNLYGPYDNFDPINAHLIPAAIVKAHNAKDKDQKIEIWGKGEVKREFLFVEDLANFIKIFLNNFDSMPTECNLGAEEDYTVLEFYEKICDTVGIQKNFVFLSEKPTGMKRKKLHIDFQESINWKPKFNLEEGLSKTYEFYKKTIK